MEPLILALILSVLFTGGLVIRFLVQEGVIYIPYASKYLMAEQDHYLDKYFVFYHNLNPGEKKIFLNRINHFINIKSIVGRNHFEVTPEVKWLVAAASIQLSFGLRKYTLPSFKTIYIYPDIYLNPYTKQYHRGDVHPAGLIAMSWKHFLRGYADFTDRINLGLHEMAHALFLTILKNDDDYHDIDKYLDEVVSISKQELKDYSEKFREFFREYAAKNVHEFFAVSVEHFFEAPVEFKAKFPVLYEKLSQLLNQDPAIGKRRVK